MKISIIVTAFKDRGFMNESIQSAISQNFDDYEVILCSDGNEELRKYADKYNIPFFCPFHGGSVPLLNRSIDIAKGEWIKILNDDDLLKPDCLSDLYDGRGDSDLVYGHVERLDHSRTHLTLCPEKVTFDTMYPFKSNKVNWVGILINRNALIDSGCFDPMCGYAYDYALYLAMLSRGYKFAYVNKVVASYRVHPDQRAGHDEAIRARDLIYLHNLYADNKLRKAETGSCADKA